MAVVFSAFIADMVCYHIINQAAAAFCTIPFLIANVAFCKILNQRKKIKYNNILRFEIYAGSVLFLVFIYGLFLICLSVYSTAWDIVRYIITWFVIVSAIIILKYKIQVYFRLKKEERNKEEKQKLLDYYDFCRNKDEFIDNLFIDYAERPTDFEKFVANLMTAVGYKNVKVTAAVNDGGKDITAVKDDNFYVVEVKLYSKDNKIGREKIQKLHSAMIDSNADKAIFVTTSDFTANAIEYAEKFSIQTINGDNLYNIYLNSK